MVAGTGWGVLVGVEIEGQGKEGEGKKMASFWIIN